MDTAFRQILNALSGQGMLLLPLAVLLGLGAIAAIYRRPAVGAGLILAAAPLEGFLMVGGNSVVKLATLLCVVVFVVRVLLVTQGFRFDSTAAALIAFVAWTFASMLWGPQNGSSLSTWVSFALSTSLYLVLLNFVLSKDDLKLVIWGHVVGGAVLAAVLINVEVAQAFQRKDAVAGLGLNLAARLTALNALLSILLFQLETTKLKRMFALGSVVVSVIASVVSLSRGAWVSLLFSIAALLAVYMVTRRVKIKLSYVVVAVVAVFATVTILNRYVLDEHGTEKLSARFDSGITMQDDAGGRFEIWQVGWTMFSDAPVHGHGYDSFGHYFDYYAGSSGLGLPNSQESKAPHNSFVGILVQFGVIGFALFLAVMFSALRRAWVVWRKGSNNSSALAWVAALAAFLVVANFVDYAIDRKYLWYALGLIVLIARYWGAEEVTKVAEVSRAPAHRAAALRLRGSSTNT
jgi:O-antigen ligase